MGAWGSGEETRQTLQTLQTSSSAATDGEPTSPSFNWLHGLLDALGSGAAYKGSRVRQCPAHADAHPSLHVSPGKDGKVVIYCHAGCEWRTIVAAIGIPARYLFEPPPVDPRDYAQAFLTPIDFPPLSTRVGKSPQARGFRLESIHDYGPNHRVLRYRKGDRKDMFWETRRGNVWEPGLYGTPTSALPIYCEVDIRKAVAADEVVLLVESESSVDALTKAGWYSTTWAGGASSVQATALLKVLDGYRRLVLIPDHDDAGFMAARVLDAAGLVPHYLLPEPGEDARDLLTRVGADEFRRLITETLT